MFALPNSGMNGFSAVTLNGGMKMTSWHDIRSLNEIDVEKCEGLSESRQSREYETVLPLSVLMLLIQ